MKRTHLLKVLEAVRTRVPLESLLIVGSQSAHALASREIPAVEASLEVDLLLLPGQFQHKPLIQQEFGEESVFFRENGLFVHAIGIGIVSLPAGWEGRVQEVRDDSGHLVARAVEIHDTLAAKIMAGREKDFDFLRQLLDRNLCKFAIFLQRFLLLRSSAHGNAVPDRLAKLEGLLRAWGRENLAQEVQTASQAFRTGGAATGQIEETGGHTGSQLHEAQPSYRTREAPSPAS